MYQLNLRAQVSKLASLTTRWQIARTQQAATAPRRAIHLGAALAQLSALATLRVMPGGSPDAAVCTDPRDPRNW